MHEPIRQTRNSRSVSQVFSVVEKYSLKYFGPRSASSSVESEGHNSSFQFHLDLLQPFGNSSATIRSCNIMSYLSPCNCGKDPNMASTKSHLHGSGLPSTKGHAKLLIQLPGQDTCKQAKDSKRIEPKQHINCCRYFVSLKTLGLQYTAIGFGPSCRLPRWCRLQEFSHCPRQLQQSSPKLCEVSWAVIHEAMGTTPYHNIYMHMTSYSIRLCNLTVLE